MRKTYSLLSFFVSFVLLFTVCGCSGGSSDKSKTDVTNKGMLRDVTFRNGFTVSGYASNDDVVYRGEIHYDKTKAQHEAAGGGAPDWIFAQWGVKNAIAADALATTDESGAYGYATDSIGFTVNTQTGALRIALNADKEYDAPRSNGEEWPHALIEQRIDRNAHPSIGELDSLTLSLRYTVEKAENRMGEQYDPSLHAAQFQWFISLVNANEQSPDYMDRMWFGLAVYDNRYEWTQKSLTVDGGKDDATGRAIYIVRSSMYLREATEVGVANGFEYDILPQLKNAFKEVREFDGVSVFGESTLADLKVDSMNIGWELPGTFDVAVNIDTLSVDYTKITG